MLSLREATEQARQQVKGGPHFKAWAVTPGRKSLGATSPSQGPVDSGFQTVVPLSWGEDILNLSGRPGEPRGEKQFFFLQSLVDEEFLESAAEKCLSGVRGV